MGLLEPMADSDLQQHARKWAQNPMSTEQTANVIAAETHTYPAYSTWLCLINSFLVLEVYVPTPNNSLINARVP